MFSVMVNLFVLCAIVFPVTTGHLGPRNRPNIVFLLTDDQDKVMGSMDAMPFLQEHLVGKGTTFDNMFVTSPICCPSRSSILSGRYVHNNGAKNNSLSGNCANDYWMQNEEPLAFPNLLQKVGYRTFFAGKYLNKYGYPAVGGASHVPPGWDWWNGLIGSSYYYNFPMSVNGSKVHHGTHLEDYMTNVIQAKALDFLEYADEKEPVFLMLCPTASHAPFTPLPKYNASYPDRQVPRTPNFNHHANDKHWLLRQTPVNGMPTSVIEMADQHYRMRLQTLLSVDDLIRNVMAALEQKGLLENTYFIYSSDNGFHLGQFCLPVDKRMLYEFDVRVPLVVRGPNVPIIVRAEPVLNIDLGPTILDLAGIRVPKRMDGISFASLLGTEAGTSSWARSKFLIEYYGIGRPEGNPGCPNTNFEDSCIPGYACICLDSSNNTYSCVRTLTPAENSVYCEFQDAERFVEFYNMRKDPFQMKNTASELDPYAKNNYVRELAKLKRCQGQSCTF